MGIFYEQVELVNRTPVNLSVRFDGQEKTLKPGTNMVPAVVVPYAKNQNPIMGSQNPNDPTIHGARYLVGVATEGDPVEPLTKEEWETHLNRPCRMDEQALFQERYGNDPKARLVRHGKGRRTAATSLYDAGTGPKGNSSFESRE